MKRREVIAGLAATTAIWSPVVWGQQSARVRSILWVSTESQPDPFIEGFREGMREHGYVEGVNLTYVLRYASGDPAAVQAMLPELLTIPCDLIVSSGPAIRAIRSTTGRPVLFAVSGDPVALGLVKSLSRPERNFTGVTFLSLDLVQKRVELLRELLPGMRTLAILSNVTHPGEEAELAATYKAASTFSISRVVYVPFTPGPELDQALGRVRDAEADAMLVFPDAVTMIHRAKIAEFAKANHLPSMFGWREYCDAGGLASYGANQRETYFRLAAYAGRLLRGEKPADLPIEQPTKFEFVINTGTARMLGLSLPAVVLARADDVIE